MQLSRQSIFYLALASLYLPLVIFAKALDLGTHILDRGKIFRCQYLSLLLPRYTLSAVSGYIELFLNVLTFL